MSNMERVIIALELLPSMADASRIVMMEALPFETYLLMSTVFARLHMISMSSCDIHISPVDNPRANSRGGGSRCSTDRVDGGGGDGWGRRSISKRTA